MVMSWPAMETKSSVFTAALMKRRSWVSPVVAGIIVVSLLAEHLYKSPGRPLIRKESQVFGGPPFRKAAVANSM